MYQDYLHSVTFILFYLLLYTGPMQGLIFNILFLTCWLHIFFKIIVQHVCFVKGRGMRLRGIRAHHTRYKQGGITSLSVDIRAKWGKEWETYDREKLAYISTFLSPQPHAPTFHKTNVLHNDLKKNMQSTS
jgi:hypothetical protein